MKMTLSLILSLGFSVLAGAAPRVNSGGGGWACRKNDESGKVLWIKAADLIKVEFYRKNGLKVRPGDRWTLLNEQRAMIQARVPRLAALLNQHPLAIENKLYPVPTALNYVADAQLRYKPPGTSCVGGTISYVQLADTTLEGKVVYSTRVWNDPAFSEFQKAAILLHEEIYFALRESYGDGSSYRTRQVMELLYYTEDDKRLRNEIDEVLNAPPRVRSDIFGFKNAPALFNVQLSCKVYLNNAEPAELVWTPKSLGDSTAFTASEFKFQVRTSLIDGSPIALEVLDDVSGVKSDLSEDTITGVFNALRTVSVRIQRENNESAELVCSSSSPLDNDPL